MSTMPWKSLPLCVPYPPEAVLSKISDIDWQTCIDTWKLILLGLLDAPLEELQESSKQYASLVAFLVSAMEASATRIGGSSRAIHDSGLRRLIFLTTHRLLTDSKSPPPVLLQWHFLGDFRCVFQGSDACTKTLLQTYSQHGERVEESLIKVKSQLTKAFDASKSGPLEDTDFVNRLLPLARTVPGIGTYFVTGSDMLDAAAAAYSKLPSKSQSILVLFVYIGLASLIQGEKPKANLLFDHLYSLKAPVSTTTSAPPPGHALVSDLITDTPLLSIITKRLSGAQANRARTIISTLEPLRRPYSSRPRTKHTSAQKAKGKAASATPDAPVHAHRLSLITQIQDLFPDLGSAFVLALLDHFKDDVEATTAALLDDSLPPHLRSLDRTSNLPPLASSSGSAQHIPPPHSPTLPSTAQPSPPQNAQPALETSHYIPERRNKFDNDEFDNLAVSTAQLHLGKRSQPATADTLLSSGAGNQSAKAAILAALSAFDADDDERDDTYDAEDVGGTVDTSADAALPDDREEALFRAWSAPGGERLFARETAVRKSNERRKLREESNMTDEGVEGWAVMLAREPGRVRRLERLFGEKIRREGQAEVASTRWRAQADDDDDDEGEDSAAAGSSRGGGFARGGPRGRGRGRGGMGRGGNVAGSADDKATQVARQRKDANKGSRANHNRRDQRARKMARGGLPG